MARCIGLEKDKKLLQSELEKWENSDADMIGRSGGSVKKDTNGKQLFEAEWKKLLVVRFVPIDDQVLGKMI